MARRRKCRCGRPEVIRNGYSNLSTYTGVCTDCVNAEIKRVDHLDARAIQRVVKARVRAPLATIRGVVLARGAKSILSASFAEIQSVF